MNRKQILSMSAGRELDVKIAIELCELIVSSNLCITFDAVNSDFKPLKPYSTDISAAWELVELLKNRDYSVTINDASEKSRGVLYGEAKVGDWHCNFRKDDISNFTYAQTVTEAICKAALIALMEEEEK